MTSPTDEILDYYFSDDRLAEAEAQRRADDDLRAYWRAVHAELRKQGVYHYLDRAGSGLVGRPLATVEQIAAAEWAVLHRAHCRRHLSGNPEAELDYSE